MARIAAKTIDDISSRVNIVDLIGEYVDLKRSGSTFAGLCPFHDERTPSFHVTPSRGTWHCFGCGEGGDAISFIQQIENLTFRDAALNLAERSNINVIYEDASSEETDFARRRSRMYELNAAAAAFFEKSLQSPAAVAAQKDLTRRHFTPVDVAPFGAGYAPNDNRLVPYLRGEGFTAEEIIEANLAFEPREGDRVSTIGGARFRDRLMWPIRDQTGRCLGFGGRRLNDNTEIAKYINTRETLLYKKSRVLFGLDLARKEISKTQRAYVVEGYTDVVAMHTAGITNTVAACGTAFAEGHLIMLKRLVGEAGEIVFFFDGDDAGQDAALKAFQIAQKHGLKRCLAVDAKDRRDPDEIRGQSGDQALRQQVAETIPLFEMVLRRKLQRAPHRTAEERSVAVDTVATPMLAQLGDDPLLLEHYRRLIADILQVPIGLLARSSVSMQVPSAAETITTPRVDGKGSDSDERIAVAILLRDAEFAKANIDDLLRVLSEGHLTAVLNIAARTLFSAVGDVRHWPASALQGDTTEGGVDYRALLSELIVADVPVPMEDWQRFVDTVISRRTQSVEARERSVRRQSVAAETDAAERDRKAREFMRSVRAAR